MLQAAAAVAALAALVGCGGGDDKSSDKPADKPAKSSVAIIPRAIMPTCTIEGFGKPQTQALAESGDDPQAWSLRFTRRTDPARPPSPSVTTNVVVVETPLSAAPSKLPADFKRITVAGRRVRLAQPGRRSRTFAAVWATKRARYTALANGKSDRILRQFIACFP